MNIPAGFYRYNDVGKELYHYTNSNGFLSFVESKKLRLSHINFQNDAQEFYYAWNLIKEIANEYYDDLNTDIFRIDTDKIYRIFTFSLTTKRDDLSQWRGYAPSHGYCFSLNSGQLYSIVNRYNLRLERCIYNKEEQRKLIIEKIFNGVGDPANPYKTRVANTSFNPNSGMYSKMVKYVKRQILTYAGLIKHPAFAEEDEYRIISSPYWTQSPIMGPEDFPGGDNVGEVKFKTGRNSFIPFVELDFDVTIPTFNEVIIGPNPNMGLAKIGCQYLLNSSGQVACTVTNSLIPYRSW